MDVKLIDYTGRRAPDKNYTAKVLIYTKSTRLTQGQASRDKIDNMNSYQIEEELNYIANTIRSSWEFIDYTFEITGVTRAFTHQFVRTRTASFAQQTMRTLVMDDFDVLCPDSILNDEDALSDWSICINSIAYAYDRLISRGIKPEDARGLLPTNIKTNIIAKMNLRTLADLVGKRDNPRAQGEYTNVIKAMAESAMFAHPWIKNFLYPERSETPELNKLLKFYEGTPTGQGEFYTPDGISKLPKGPDLKTIYKEIDKLKAIWG